MLDIQRQTWLIVAIAADGLSLCCPKAGDHPAMGTCAIASVQLGDAAPGQLSPFHRPCPLGHALLLPGRWFVVA